MKNIDIIGLVNGGALAITANELGAEHAYKVLKFKKAVKKAFEAYLDAEKDILKESGIENPEAFDAERKKLAASGANPKRLAELNKAFARFSALRSNLYKDEAHLEEVKAMPYAAFHELQKENKNLAGKPLNTFEDILEGVLWTAPEENE